MGMANLSGYVEGVVDGKRTNGVFEGGGLGRGWKTSGRKWRGRICDGPLRPAPQFVSLATSQVDPTETTTYGLPLSLDRFFSSLDHLPRLQELCGVVGRREVVVFVCLCSSETGENEDTFYG